MYMTAKSGWTHRQVNILLGALGCEVHPAVLEQAAVFRGQYTYLMGDGLRPGFLGTSSLPVSNSRCWINSAFPRGLPVREFAFIESSSAGLSVCDR